MPVWPNSTSGSGRIGILNSFGIRPTTARLPRPSTPPTARGSAPLDSTAQGSGLASAERERVDDSWRIFPTVRENRFNEMEYSVPAERGVECFLEVRDLIRTKHRQATWPVEYRTVAADEILISPAQGRDRVHINPRGRRPAACGILQRRRDNFSPPSRPPALGQAAQPRSPRVGRAVSRVGSLSASGTRLDPAGRFLNEHLRRLFV